MQVFTQVWCYFSLLHGALQSIDSATIISLIHWQGRLKSAEQKAGAISVFDALVQKLLGTCDYFMRVDDGVDYGAVAPCGLQVDVKLGYIIDGSGIAEKNQPSKLLGAGHHFISKLLICNSTHHQYDC